MPFQFLLPGYTAIDEPDWVVFECEYVGVSGETCWIVIDMNHDVNVELWQVNGLMKMYPAPLSRLFQILQHPL